MSPHGFEQVQEAVAFIRAQLEFSPQISLTLGSGLGSLADELENPFVLPYAQIPHFPVSTAPGHAGELVLGTLEGKKVMCYKGRTHYYEGYSMEQVMFPVRVAHALGAKTFIITNACGGLRDDWHAGDLMLQRDLINFTGTNPLIGSNDTRWGERFPVMFDLYDEEYRALTQKIARAQNLDLKDGVYLGISGPTYATRAELRMYRAWGADTIGMSTVAEVMAARHLGARVLGISTVTDLAIPERENETTEQRVIEVARASSEKFKRLLRGVVGEMRV
ncbi:MAG: purine-nucleoside phosphorylase [Pseudopedobacter sp.]|nr:purine-nucleoside phosphorylase [Deinococcales bacterium]